MFKLSRKEKFSTSTELRAQSEVLFGERNARIADLKARLQKLFSTIDSLEHTGADFNISEISNIKAEIQKLEKANLSAESSLNRELLELSKIEDEIAHLEAAAGRSDGALYEEEMREAEKMVVELGDKETLESLRERLYSGLFVSPEEYDAAVKEYLYAYYYKAPEKGRYWSMPKAILSLSADDSEKAWAIRAETQLSSSDMISSRTGDPTIISTLGIDTERAQEFRQAVFSLCEQGKYYKGSEYHNFVEYLFDINNMPGALMLSTIGLDSPEAQKLRDSLLAKAGRNAYIVSHAGLDTTAAWAVREKFLDENFHAVLASLLGLNSARAREMRNYYLTQNVTTEIRQTIVSSTTGLDGNEEWKIRDKALKLDEYYLSLAVLKSLAGIDSEKAWAIRDRFFVKIKKIKKDKSKDESETLVALLESLDGLSDARALEMRRELITYVEKFWDNPDSTIAANIKSFELILSQLAQAKRAW